MEDIRQNVNRVVEIKNEINKKELHLEMRSARLGSTNCLTECKKDKRYGR